MSVPAGLLTAMRRDAGRLLIDTCVVLRATPVVDDSGGEGPGTPAAHATVPCLVAPQPRERFGFGNAGDRPTHRDRIDVSMPVGTEVAQTDAIKHVQSGKVLTVVGMAQPRTMEAVVRVVCERND